VRPELIVNYTRSPSAPKEPFTRANPSDAGIDIRSAEDAVIQPLGRATVPTGLRLQIPEGYYGRIAPRSGLAHNFGIDVLAGVVDSSYRGEIKVILHNTDKEEAFRVSMGDRIAQLIIEKHYNPDFVEVEDLDSTDRGSGGFGSSGK
jgi:dUTP pyrophosphatase